jgi:uncharacterized protein YndB with AHSA1/START domain
MTSAPPAEGTVLQLRRTLPARREDVFRAWTQSDLFSQWFAPPGGESSAELDARVGGTFSVEMRSPMAPTVHAEGTYLEVVPPERLVFTLTWQGYPFDTGDTLVTVEFHERAQMTEVVLVHERQPSRLVHACHWMGWRACLRRLERGLATGRLPLVRQSPVA